MNEPGTTRNIILLLGSNIHPENNITRALILLANKFPIFQLSSNWETEPVHSIGNNFNNLAISIRTKLDRESLRRELRQIETELGRIRTPDKYAPRTMDIDIIVDDGQVVDEKLWEFAFIAVPVSQIVPDLINPKTSEPLSRIAHLLKEKYHAIELPKK